MEAVQAHRLKACRTALQTQAYWAHQKPLLRVSAQHRAVCRIRVARVSCLCSERACCLRIVTHVEI